MCPDTNILFISHEELFLKMKPNPVIYLLKAHLWFPIGFKIKGNQSLYNFDNHSNFAELIKIPLSKFIYGIVIHIFQRKEFRKESTNSGFIFYI